MEDNKKRIDSIMRETFNLDTKKPRKISIKETDKPIDILFKFNNYIKRNKEVITVGDIKKTLSELGYNEVQILKEYPPYMDDLLRVLTKDKGETTDYGVVQYKESDEDRYLLIDRANNVTPSKQGADYKFTTKEMVQKGISYKFQSVNLSDMYALGKILSLVPYNERLQRIEQYVKESEGLEETYKKRRDKIGDNELTKQITSEFSRLIYKRSKKGFFYFYSSIMVTIYVEKLMEVYNKELNYQLMAKYQTDLTKDYARAFQTKKNIPVKVQEAMSKSRFLKNGFSFVEYDQDSDLRKVALVEDEWIKLNKQLPHSSKKPVLRFRKLGNYKAWGVYFPSHDCVAVDLRHIESFTHEYAHHLDYTFSDGPLSLKDDFLPIINRYRELWGKNDSKNKPDDTDYYTTPTEIFARGYEVYQAQQGVTTSLLTSKNAMSTQFEYNLFNDKQLNQLINQYYKNTFN